MNNTALIVHGGAWDIPDEVVENHLRGCCNALRKGWSILSAGGSALDAVTGVVIELENDPTFDAGRGAFLNKAGEVELDASIMDGGTLAAGAVAAMSRYKNPVTVARAVMERTEHVLLVGKGAEAFAHSCGFIPCPTEELLVGRELARYAALKQSKEFTPKQAFQKSPKGTVGAVACDQIGHLAAATSTGGTPQKMPGRVGDTPLIGAGTFADDTSGAASATGWGEGIMKVLLAKTVCDLQIQGLSAQQAADKAVAMMKQKVDGRGGVIAVSPGGDLGFAFNTPRMAFAYLCSGMDDCVVAV